MTTKNTQEASSQGRAKAAKGSLARDVGLDHEPTPNQDQLSLTDTIRRLFGRIPRAPRKNS